MAAITLFVGIFLGAWQSGFIRPIIRFISAGKLCRDPAPVAASEKPAA